MAIKATGLTGMEREPGCLEGIIGFLFFGQKRTYVEATMNEIKQ